jgi:hypothetical protein
VILSTPRWTGAIEILNLTTLNKEVLVKNFLPDNAAVTLFGESEIRQMRMVLDPSKPYQA